MRTDTAHNKVSCHVGFEAAVSQDMLLGHIRPHALDQTKKDQPQLEKKKTKS